MVLKSVLKVDIAAYDDDLAISGPASWAVRVPLLLRDRGIDVRLLLFNWGCGENGMVARSCRSCQLPYATKQFCSTEENVSWFLNQIAGRNADVVICNHVVPALLAAGTLRQCGIPSILILRSDDEFYRATVDCFVGGRPQDQVSAVVGVSEFLTDLARRRNASIRAEKICSGTPTPIGATKWNAPLRIAFCGRFVEEQKRIRLTAQSILNACRSVSGTTAIMIGDGPELNHIRGMVADSGLPVDVRGRVDPLVAQQELGAAQVQVLFSDYEGLPTSLLEGMGQGVVPVVTDMQSGIRELVTNGYTGYIVGDPLRDLPLIVQRLTSNQNLWCELSRNSRDRVLTDFTSERSADKWCHLLHSLAEGAQRDGEGKALLAHFADLCPPDIRLSREDRRQPITAITQPTTLFRRIAGRFARLLRRHGR